MKKWVPIIAYFFIIQVLFSACSEEEQEFRGFTINEVQRLLATDTFKVWKPVALSIGGEAVDQGSCDLNTEWIFTNEISDVSEGQEAPSFYFLPKSPFCAIEDTISLFYGFSQADVEDEIIDTLLLFENTISGNFYVIEQLTSQELRLRTFGQDSLAIIIALAPVAGEE